MKKFLTFLLVVSLMLSISAVASASSKNPLVYNPGFEEGLEPWFSLTGDPDVVSVTSAQAHSGKNSCFVTNRKEPWYCVAQDVTDIVKKNGPGKYYATAFIKTKSGFDSANPTLAIESDDGFKAWFSVGLTAIDNSEWYQLSVENGQVVALNGPDNSGKVYWTGNLTKATLYFGTTGKTDFYIDDINFWKDGQTVNLTDKNQEKPAENKATESKTTETTNKTEAADTGKASTTTTSSNKSNNPKTGDAGILVAFAAVAISGGTLLMMRKRK